MKRTFIGFDALGKKIRLSEKEWRAHMLVIGSSDTGKSKLLEWLMRGDLRERQGFILADRHGTLYDEMVYFAAHHVLPRDLVLLNLSQPDSIIGFNPFRAVRGVEISAQVDRRIAATFRAWNVRSGDATPTLERTLRLVYTIMIEQQLGLAETKHLITYQAREVRERLIDRLQSPMVQKEWEELQKLNRKDWQEEVLSAKNRLFRLLSSETLTRFMGLPERSVDIGEIIEKNKTVLVNLAESDYLSSENARVFGALLVNEIFEAAKRRRPDAHGRDPRPYRLYIDEFQNFVTHDIGDMLDQVRKRGLYVILAHQRFGQVDEDVVEAAIANCHIKAVFGGLTVPNARRMAEELFIGKLDARRVKAAIYQTKFWPQYRRDTVYTRSQTEARAHGHGNHSEFGNSGANAQGAFFGPDDWFGGSGSNSVQQGWFSSGGSGDTDTESSGVSEAEADIPIFVPVPFKELSNLQYFTPEEQLMEFTAALKGQFQRHCFVKIHQRDTQPMLVPFVRRFSIPAKNLAWYTEKLLKAGKALPPHEVDRLIRANEEALIQSVLMAAKVPEDFHE